MLKLERDILYEDSDFEIDSDDEADLEQSELPYLTKRNPTIPRSPDSFATFRKDATNPEVLRTFDSGISPSLIVEPAT